MMVPSWLTRLCTLPVWFAQPMLANSQAVAGQVGLSSLSSWGLCTSPRNIHS